jgi:hypothetical protein
VGQIQVVSPVSEAVTGLDWMVDLTVWDQLITGGPQLCTGMIQQKPFIAV